MTIGHHHQQQHLSGNQDEDRECVSPCSPDFNRSPRSQSGDEDQLTLTLREFMLLISQLSNTSIQFFFLENDDDIFLSVCQNVFMLQLRWVSRVCRGDRFHQFWWIRLPT
jgi:hypothetical protein